MTLNVIRQRITFTPPPVDPADPPTNINASSTALAVNPQYSKLAVQYPVVVWIEVTWKRLYRNAEPIEASCR